MEQINYFVSSRGILKSTDIHNYNPISSNGNINFVLNEENSLIKNIYVCSDALENFSDNYLGNIRSRFILVTGDSDRAIDSELIIKKEIQNILNCPFLDKWYAQNLTVSNPKLFHLPIGIDFHTMWEKPGVWGLTKESPVAQERSLIGTLASSNNIDARYPYAYCNWQFAIERGDRKDCFLKIDKNFCFFEKNFTSRISSWQRQANFKYVISPEGAGIDCHRTWEALLLGCIPIVKKSFFTNIFEDLPVIILEDWGECFNKNIEAKFNRIKDNKFNYSKLFLKHWVSLLKNKDGKLLDLMTMNEFKNYICHISY